MKRNAGLRYSREPQSVRKEQLVVRQEGKRYLYRPVQSREGVAKRLLKNLVGLILGSKFKLRHLHTGEWGRHVGTSIVLQSLSLILPYCRSTQAN